MSEREFDLFISYADANRFWVEGFLIPALGLPENKVITQQRFQPGAQIINEFERAVECSRYVVIVFSQAFLVDPWARFGDYLANYANQAGGNEKLIPLILDEIALPLHAQFRVQLNCAEESRWKTEIERLREVLRAPKPVSKPVPSPYPGLRHFGGDNAQYFFGREAEIEDLVLRLRRQNFLLVVGPSGSGKSSLVLCGLFHVLGQRNPDQWEMISIRPGTHPAAALDRVTGEYIDPADGLPNGASGKRPLIVIDQLEELFLLAAPVEQAEAIQKINQIRRSGVCALILVLRADFYGDLMNSALWPVDPAQRFDLGPLREDGLRRAIQQPALSAGVFIEDQLVERLVVDAEGQAGALPLMQEALSILWDQRLERLLPFSAYRRLGGAAGSGVARAIAIHADGVFDQLLPGEQAAARQILVRLVQFNEGRPDTRRQVPRSILLGSANPQPGRAVIQKLTEGRLITLDRDAGGEDALVDLAHESLIYAWPRMQEWIQKDRAAEVTRRRLLERARAWQNLDYRGGLLDAVELASARRWLADSSTPALGVDEIILALVEASTKALRVSARRRWTVPAAAVISAVILALLVWQGWLLSLRVRADRLNPPVPIAAGRVKLGDENANLDFVRRTKEFSVPAFLMDEHEVTNQQYCMCRKTGACTNDPSYPLKNVCDTDMDFQLLPVTQINLEDASKFCRWLGRRLPTEIEWEWAAKGKDNNPYPTGADLPAAELINLFHLDGSLWPVNRFSADRLPYAPVFGMAGNAREWTVSVLLPYDDERYPGKYWPDSFTQEDQFVVVRGGSYLTITENARSIFRYNLVPQDPAPDLGFRCVLGVSLEEFSKLVVRNAPPASKTDQ